MKTYIAGPMSNHPDLNFPAFHAAAAHLRSLGRQVVNPAEINPDPEMPWVNCMRADIRELVTCDAIAMLPGWEASKGAKLEHHIATELDLTVIYLDVPA